MGTAVPIRDRTVRKCRRTVQPAHAALPQAQDASRRPARDNRRMDIQLNGDALSVSDGTTVRALVEQQALGARRVAVEVNGEIVPRGRHAEHVLQAGDKVEIVHALGGG